MRVIVAAILLAACTVATSAEHSAIPNAAVLSAAFPGTVPEAVAHAVPESAAAVGAAAAIDGETRAMNEMLRGTAGHERHWMQRPSLVVVTTVMAFANGAHQDFQTIDAHIGDDDARQLVADLTAGLTLLSGRTFEHFASVRFESPSPGTSVRMSRDGEIVVGRFRGVRASLNAVGYGGRTARIDGTITSGTVMLDEDYDGHDPLRNLLRMHELGHALGFNHVESQRSIMNAILGAAPTDFDRKVARIAFSHLIADTPQPLLLASGM